MGRSSFGRPCRTEILEPSLEALDGEADRAAAGKGKLDGAGGGIGETGRTGVWFRALDEAEIAAYADTGEGLDKAGAYAIQGVGAFAVERIEGSYSNVVGLPACEVVLALGRAGLLGGFPLPGEAPR